MVALNRVFSVAVAGFVIASECEASNTSAVVTGDSEVPLPLQHPPPRPRPHPQPHGGGGKKGAAIHPSAQDAKALSAAGVHWYHNWGTRANPGTESLKFHPTVWGKPQLNSLGGLQHDSVLFGFNEPNMNHKGGGSDMSAGEAAKDWPKVESAAKKIGAHTLVAPQLAWINPNTWYDKFFQACHGCKDKLQGVAAHTYNCDMPSLKKFVGLFKKYNKPLWITEFACAHKSAAENCNYIKQAVPYLESEHAVAGYSWFSSGSTALVSNGKLTQIGKCYTEARAEVPLFDNITEVIV